MYVKTCACGTEFTATNIRQIKCRKGCRRTGAHTRRSERIATHDMTFIGVDGEGVTRPDGTHEYVMLSVGDKTLFDKGQQLSLEKILHFLWECYIRNQDAVYVGFFLGYDFVQWQKLLPEKIAWSLLTTKGIEARKAKRASGDPTPDPVVWEQWEMDMLAGRRFKLRPHVHKPSKYDDSCRNKTCSATVDIIISRDPMEPLYIGPAENEWLPDMATLSDVVNSVVWSRFTRKRTRNESGSERRSWLYICDTGPFWQSSFLKVIDPSAWDKPVCTAAEYETIVKGKSGRDIVVERGDISYYSEMVKYNTLENDILARVTARLNQGFMNEHIPIRIPKADWYGPGRAAQIWMDNLGALITDKTAVSINKLARSAGMHRHRENEYGIANADVYLSMPDWMYEAAKSTYYGGWFEIFMHGHVGDVFEYDINSAYPAIIATLPCLHTEGGHTGRYYKGEGVPDCGGNDYVIVYATITGRDPHIGAMPLRTVKGSICRPQKVRGWYWQHEVNAATRAGLIDKVEVHEYFGYTPCSCTPPFNPADIGIERMYQLRLDVGKNTPQGKGFKLVYNSAYGKTAQSIGSPKYSNPFYASLITAGCRTMILDAIATHPMKSRAVAMVATDGVYFTSPHPSLELSSSKLGAWDVTEKYNLTLLMPGVYWDDKARKAVSSGSNPKLKSRGINASDLAAQISTLDALFLMQELLLRTEGTYEWPSITFTVNFMMDTAKLALQRGKWETAGKVYHGSTRSVSSNPVTKRNVIPYWDEIDKVVRTYPYQVGEELETLPYQLMFGMPVEENRSLFPGQVGRDGSIGGWDWRSLTEGDL